MIYEDETFAAFVNEEEPEESEEEPGEEKPEETQGPPEETKDPDEELGLDEKPSEEG